MQQKLLQSNNIQAECYFKDPNLQQVAVDTEIIDSSSFKSVKISHLLDNSERFKAISDSIQSEALSKPVEP